MEMDGMDGKREKFGEEGVGRKRKGLVKTLNMYFKKW